MLALFFELQNNIQLYHWSCTIYARHKVSDELYKSLGDLIDKYVEVYSGKYGRPKLSGKINVKHMNDKEIIDYINNIILKIKKIAANDDTDLCNIRDEILSSLNQTLYLFTFH